MGGRVINPNNSQTIVKMGGVVRSSPSIAGQERENERVSLGKGWKRFLSLHHPP